jgi:hypothetical protein
MIGLALNELNRIVRIAAVEGLFGREYIYICTVRRKVDKGQLIVYG